MAKARPKGNQPTPTSTWIGLLIVSSMAASIVSGNVFLRVGRADGMRLATVILLHDFQPVDTLVFDGSGGLPLRTHVRHLPFPSRNHYEIVNELIHD